MRWLAVLLISLTAFLPALAEDWTTADGKTYRHVTVVGVESDGVRITYDGGVGKFPFYELPLDVQKRLGVDIDSLLAKKRAADKALADAQAAAAAAQKAQEAAAAAAASTAQAQNGQRGSAANPQASAAAAAAARAAQAQARSQAQAQAQAEAQAQAASSAAPSEYNAAYPGSKFSYNETLDLSYLDSFPAKVIPDSDSSAPSEPGDRASLTLRIVSEGRQADLPTRVEGIFVLMSQTKKLPDDRTVVFFANGVRLPIAGTVTDKKDGNFVSSPGVEYDTFYLTPEQLHLVEKSNELKFTIGGQGYQVDSDGMAAFQRYFADVDKLPPAPTGIMKTISRFYARLPAIIAMISKVCEYIILGSFTILVVAAIAAFVLGMSRFIKM